MSSRMRESYRFAELPGKFGWRSIDLEASSGQPRKPAGQSLAFAIIATFHAFSCATNPVVFWRNIHHATNSLSEFTTKELLTACEDPAIIYSRALL
jgi:hypothetical protein